MKNIVFAFFLLISSFSFSQFLEDGLYSFTDGDMYTLDIQICNGGWTICSFNFMHDQNTIDFTESGEWFRVNLNGVEENIVGPIGWYQAYTEETSYEFENLSDGTFKLTRGEESYIMTMLQ
jgi:hypothetical protein